MWLNWLEHRYAVHWNVVGSIPCQGTNLKPRFQGWIPGPGSHSIFLSLIDVSFLLFFFLRFYLFIFRERGSDGEREGEKHWCMRDTLVSCLSLTPKGGPGQQPGHVPWPGIERWPFSSQAGAQFTEPHQPGLTSMFLSLSLSSINIFKKSKGIIY